MKKEIIESLIERLEGAIDEAENFGFPLNVDYERGTEGHRIQRRIGYLSRELNFKIVGELEQESFDRLVLTMKRSISVLEGSTYGRNQKERLVDVIRTGLMQTYPQLDVLDEVKEYIPEAMLSIESFL